MNKYIRKPRWYLAIVIFVTLLLRYVIFAPQINRIIQITQWMISRRQEYRSIHPQATSSETQEAYYPSIDRLSERQDQYIKDHPNASDEEISNAFEAWSGSKVM